MLTQYYSYKQIWNDIEKVDKQGFLGWRLHTVIQQDEDNVLYILEKHLTHDDYFKKSKELEEKEQ